MRRDTSDFDKGDLKDQLKRAGFEDCVADNIADRVNDRKARGWTSSVGRQEAIREAELIINSSKAALDNFRGNTATTTADTDRDMEQRSRTVLKA